MSTRDNENPYCSPDQRGPEVKTSPSGRNLFNRVLVALHAVVTLNWGIAVAWMYSESLKPSYPMFYTPPPGLQPYATVSAWAALLSLPLPLALTIYLILRRKAWSLSLGELGICLLSFALSGLELWLFRIMSSPPIHAI